MIGQQWGGISGQNSQMVAEIKTVLFIWCIIATLVNNGVLLIVMMRKCQKGQSFVKEVSIPFITLQNKHMNGLVRFGIT